MVSSSENRRITWPFAIAGGVGLGILLSGFNPEVVKLMMQLPEQLAFIIVMLLPSLGTVGGVIAHHNDLKE